MPIEVSRTGLRTTVRLFSYAPLRQSHVQNVSKNFTHGQINRPISQKSAHNQGKGLLSIDCHTHMYTPKYMKILHSRTSIPRVSIHDGVHRLIILPDEDKETTTAAGRVIGREYWDVQAKLTFMDNHRIAKSVISLANPWLGDLHHIVL